MKENELQYVKKEVQCLREELQMMQKVSVSGSHWEGSRREEGGEHQGFMSAGFRWVSWDAQAKLCHLCSMSLFAPELIAATRFKQHRPA